ncbi:MAG: multicopper oxidase domain-containing protein [Thermoflexibacter sp.]|jgi:FtsP/CotA-like multicopper oxidase with cupredoxin domain|nr:multicopper oxidase domain-containing protein [Thermoflexibacter sp.]
MKVRILYIAILLLGSSYIFAQKTIRYDLYVTDTVVNYTGKKAKGIAINGQIPAPTLVFVEGDTAEIHVHNLMHMETSIHWHGLILPNEQDGVPYLTTAPIKAHSTHIYRFPIVQNGTYWYHSHTMLQEQNGMYGAFIIHKRKVFTSLKSVDNEVIEAEQVILLSDWTNENPHQIQRSLHNATDWYAVKKGATQSYGEALAKGYLGTKFINEWKRMLSMDVADVYYDQFWINGKQTSVNHDFKAGEKVRLRIINGASSSYFWLQYAGGKMTVVATDGIDVNPVEVDRMIIAVAETYDVIVTIPENGSYEFKATTEDRTNSTSLFLGQGKGIEVPDLPKLNYFEGMKMMNGMMKTSGKMDDMGMQMSLQQMDMNAVMYQEKWDTLTTLNYAMLKSPVKTTLPDVPFRELTFELTGNMNRYIWTLDNKTVSETDRILIKQGENIRIILYNGSMMRHPIHLHGHFFRVLNGQDEYSPLKNVLDIMPMERDTIEFHASEKYGDWYFHCHILYHMMAGMGRIFRYENTPPNPQITNPKKALRKVYQDDRHFYSRAEIALESNGSDGEIEISNTRYFVQTEWRIGLNDQLGYESESHVGRFFGRNQFLRAYIGWDYRYRKDGLYNPNNGDNIFGNVNTKNDRQVLCMGIQYVLPLHIVSEFRVDNTGLVRFQMRREDFPLTKRMRLNAMINSDLEYTVGARYIMNKYISLSTHYDSDMKWGGGLTITY